jgi:hypothetical protein
MLPAAGWKLDDVPTLLKISSRILQNLIRGQLCRAQVRSKCVSEVGGTPSYWVSFANAYMPRVIASNHPGKRCLYNIISHSALLLPWTSPLDIDLLLDVALHRFGWGNGDALVGMPENIYG